MTKYNKPRKTTREERIRIVEYCIASANNYALAAKEFKGLYDRRGRNKPVDELTELEKLQAENRLLKAQAKQQQMEIDFLKKLDAVERR